MPNTTQTQTETLSPAANEIITSMKNLMDPANDTYDARLDAYHRKQLRDIRFAEAREGWDASYAKARASGGAAAEKQLRYEVLTFTAPIYGRQLRSQIGTDTAAIFRPFVDAANEVTSAAKKSTSGSTRWTGDAFANGLIAVMQDFQGLIINRDADPYGHKNLMPQIPLRLAIALCRGWAEIIPAVHAGISDKEKFDQVEVGLYAFAQSAITELMAAHQELADESNQYREFCEWTAVDAKRSTLLTVVNTCASTLRYMTKVARQYAPGGNPHSAMMVLEVDHQLRQLKDTLRLFAPH